MLFDVLVRRFYEVILQIFMNHENEFEKQRLISLTRNIPWSRKQKFWKQSKV